MVMKHCQDSRSPFARNTATHQGTHFLVTIYRVSMPPDGLQAQQAHSILQPPQRHQPMYHLSVTEQIK